VFEHKRTNKISTADLIEALCDDDEKVWATYNRGKQLSPRQLSRKLDGYGIKSKTVRIGYTTPKGFELEQFEEAFARYLSPTPPASATSATSSNDKALSVADKTPRCGNKNQSATPEPAPPLDCCAVADTKGVSHGNGIIEVEV
jgi:putative DNA primase/helicase